MRIDHGEARRSEERDDIRLHRANAIGEAGDHVSFAEETQRDGQ